MFLRWIKFSDCVLWGENYFLADSWNKKLNFLKQKTQSLTDDYFCKMHNMQNWFLRIKKCITDSWGENLFFEVSLHETFHGCYSWCKHFVTVFWDEKNLTNIFSRWKHFVIVLRWLKMEWLILEVKNISYPIIVVKNIFSLIFEIKMQIWFWGGKQSLTDTWG